MRTIRRLFQVTLTLIGGGIALFAVLSIEGLYDRILVAALGLLIMQLGIWQFTGSLVPNQREYRPLRKETDYFLQQVRLLNRAALAATRGSDFARAEVERLHLEMHHSVDRMRKLAGLTESELGFKYRPAPSGAEEKLNLAARAGAEPLHHA